MYTKISCDSRGQSRSKLTNNLSARRQTARAEVQLRGGRRAAGQKDDVAERRQLGVEAVDRVFQASYIRGFDAESGRPPSSAPSRSTSAA